MNKKGQEGLFIMVAILVITVIVVGVMYLDKVSNDIGQKSNCENMEKNGYKTKLEIFEVLGFDRLDCYVENSPGKYVPYDRFRGTDQ